jgi:hypothetical protein
MNMKAIGEIFILLNNLFSVVLILFGVKDVAST